MAKKWTSAKRKRISFSSVSWVLSLHDAWCWKASVFGLISTMELRRRGEIEDITHQRRRRNGSRVLRRRPRPRRLQLREARQVLLVADYGFIFGQHKAGLGATEIVRRNPERNWKVSTIQRAIEKLKVSKCNNDLCKNFFKETNGNCRRKSGSGRPISARTDENFEKVRELYYAHEQAGTHFSVRDVAAALNISKSTAHVILKEDLGLAPYRPMNVQRLTRVQMERRLLRSQQLLRKFDCDDIVDRIIFTDEKIFTIDHKGFPQLDRVWASKKDGKKAIPVDR